MTTSPSNRPLPGTSEARERRGWIALLLLLAGLTGSILLSQALWGPIVDAELGNGAGPGDDLVFTSHPPSVFPEGT